MASKKCLLVFVVLFFCILSFSAKTLARNIVDSSELYAFSDEKGLNKRLLQENRRAPCKRGKRDQMRQARDNPRCHNYL
ncbi:hypothetical protein MtrunA17_Chr4g0018981 [Medicago truncatula]|uniref:Nodule Cysteine-Rich (NCR) secreted peptide n=1 Tax=Medicago truncatula TaxID=3880 RepID=A0A072UIG7_MEDTR|nr:Nodule Cysteine-Rich (NCR) secreted peptide [Medicago truncatula]KEH29457.1 RALF-like protein [Medicago truncatula]RHN59878.1 hypothetical protein MtrunA17_Chr4g0018981 [Medicago truncatula]